MSMQDVASFFAALFGRGEKREESFEVRELKREVYSFELQLRAAERVDDDSGAAYCRQMLEFKRSKLRAMQGLRARPEKRS